MSSVPPQLREQAAAWVEVPLAGRVALLRRAIQGVLRVADRWVDEACRRRAIDPRSPLAGEEWMAGPMTTVRQLRLLAEALEQDGTPRPPSIRRTEDGRTVARVFPGGWLDRLLYYDMSAELWIERGKPASQGRIYRERRAGVRPTGGTALVLGAGNVSSIAPLDVAHQLFVLDRVVVLKMNPVNAWLRPYFEDAFRDWIGEGFLTIVEGDAETGAAICRDERIDAIHLTGAESTYDAIRRVTDTPITAELGCVTPVLIVPGPWSSGDLDFQARHVASMLAHNAGYDCNAAKVVVTARGWELRDTFLDRLERALDRLPRRMAYYPGAVERHRAFRERYPHAGDFGRDVPDSLPWTLARDVPANADEPALAREAFCSVLAEVALDAGDAAAFVDAAVPFVNESVHGSLSCIVLASRATQDALGPTFERAVRDLRYGGVGVNVWTGVNFGLGVTSWGAFPGNTPDAIGSGVGAVHNTYLFDHPEKSVVRAPFRLRPTPAWFADHRTLRSLGRRLTRFEAHPTPWGLAAVIAAGLPG